MSRDASHSFDLSSGNGGSSSGGGAVDKDPDVIVLDLGCGSIKAGWAGEDAPRAVVPTLLLQFAAGGGGGGGSGSGGAGANAAGTGGSASSDPSSSSSHHSSSAADQNQLDQRSEYLVGQQAIQTLHNTAAATAAASSSSHPSSSTASAPSSRALGVSSSSHPHPQLLRPLDRGGSSFDVEALTKVLDHIFKVELRVNPKDHPVMITVAPLASPEARAELAKVLFEGFAVPALCMANQAVLSLYSTGRTTGLVLELGEGMSYSVPIYEGFALKHAILSIPVAGQDVTTYLARQLAERGFGFGGGMGGGAGTQAPIGPGAAGALAAQLDTVRDIKEKLCRVKASAHEYDVVPIPHSNAATAVAQASAPQQQQQQQQSQSSSTTADLDETSYELPDGRMIRLDDHCRFNSLEILFNPEKYAMAMGVPHMTGGIHACYGIPPNSASVAGGGVGAGMGVNMGSGVFGGGGLGSSSGGPTTPAHANTPAGGSGSGGFFSSASGSGSGSGSIPSSASRPRAGSFASSPSSASSTSGSTSSTSTGGGTGPILIDLSTNPLMGVHRMLFTSLQMCDGFVRKDLMKNVVLAGGTSMAKGIGERMKREVQALLHRHEGGGGMYPSHSQSDADSPLTIITDSQRKYAAWIGASMYASLATFNIIKITAEQYKRDENIVHKKFI